MNDNNPFFSYPVGARRAALSALPAIQILKSARTEADAKRAAASIAAACTRQRPAWYREDRPGDRYLGTLASGEVLAWACGVTPDEPLELMAWVDEWQGACVWRPEA
ncbi:hypothetical protein [Methylobacterium platani]|uniref:Uncharacterized protein n=2 Tax=Methylobacterium platani TaxID=427683 RepID=A0A179SDG1_9HYPH|nr:hypothetical protein [Methylobacterium platani]KMO15954.1 hypothetical protein SQ03_15915 [Methylobacterium platani JCM 14648]OAS24894.1 hypothetical protein A5481_12440 [Methylobacterium platani]